MLKIVAAKDGTTAVPSAAKDGTTAVHDAAKDGTTAVPKSAESQKTDVSSKFMIKHLQKSSRSCTIEAKITRERANGYEDRENGAPRITVVRTKLFPKTCSCSSTRTAPNKRTTPTERPKRDHVQHYPTPTENKPRSTESSEPSARVQRVLWRR